MRRQGIAFVAFTARGQELGGRLQAALGGRLTYAREDPAFSLSAWTGNAFSQSEALVFLGAVGIAVRAVAPFLKGKAEDPAVVAVDEAGRFAVPVVSGHLGGANDLARNLASLTGGTAVITTATDLRGAFAVDVWARRQNCAIPHPEDIKAATGKLLDEETLRIFSAFPLDGTPPEGVETTEGDADIWVDVCRRPSLAVVPRALALGIGCRRGTSRETLEARFAAFLEAHNLWEAAFFAAATLDRRAEEPGVLSFCAGHGWNLTSYSPEELGRLPGTFTASAFVERHVGVDNVCERCALLAAGEGGTLRIRKFSGDGVTFAAAQRTVRLDWRS